MIAIYVRQSVDKKDSISIETQIDTCRSKVLPADKEQIEIFSDKGFSGKSTIRPELQRMMDEVKKGSISKIIVYKLDRISRSLIDFLHLREEFIRHNVTFISCGEDFDTSTPMGKLMVNIIMMFAELERETIQKRITDNYYARGEKGLYLGGYAPFGFTKVETRVNGLKTYMFQENKIESPILKQIFVKYSNGETLDNIANWLNEKNVLTRQKKNWSSTTIARVLRNPVYVKADQKIYDYLMGLGATMNNDVREYMGQKGCLVYGNAENRKKPKFVDLTGDFVTLGLHNGLIKASLWLDVQYALLKRRSTRIHNNNYTTWLQSLVQCGCGCNYHIKSYKTKSKEYKYLYCSGRNKSSCPYVNSIPLEIMEQIIQYELLVYLLMNKENLLQDNLKGSEKIKELISDISYHHDEKIKKKCPIKQWEYTLQFSTSLSAEKLSNIYNSVILWHHLNIEAKRNVIMQIIHKIIICDRHILIEYK